MSERAAALPSASSRTNSSRKTRIAALIVACALFMQNLDSTVISTALPTMAKAFGADPVHMNVALTSYLLSLAVFIPTSGWMADRFGARTVFRAAIVIFTLGSILCGRADSLAFLVISRIVQGIGGAMMVPVGRLVLVRTAPKNELVAAMAWLSMPALIGPVVGPPLGGFIVTYFSWRLIFDINIPIGILGVILVTLFIEDVREPGHSRLDFVGLAFCGVALAATMFGLETIGRGIVATSTTAALLAVGVTAGAGYFFHNRNHPAPLLDLGLLMIPTFRVSVLAGSLFRIGIGAIPYLLPLMLQVGFGLTPVQSGTITFVSSAGAIIMKPAAMGTLRRFGFRNTLFYNGVISALLLAACAAFRPSWPVFGIYAVLLFGGFLRSLQFTAYNAIAYADIPRQRISGATSLYSTIQQLSITLGISAGAAALQISMALGGVSRPTLLDFSIGFLVVGLISLLGAPASLMMPALAGAELSGHPHRARAGEHS
jgi:EmrB/QacA subfamily drug resistance transporter